jgi:uncharacterized protein (TIGR03437 family)
VPRTAGLLLSSTILLLAAAAAQGQSLVMVSGNGQIVREQFVTVNPMTVQARNAQGAPLANVAITWSISSGQGTLVNPISVTDSSGFASTNFLATDVPAGLSISAQTITAASSLGNVNFFVTTSAVRLPNGALGSPPLVEQLAPTLENRNVTGAPGATLPNALQIRVTVQTGPQLGQPVPNVGVRIYNYDDPNTSPSAVCRGPAGTVLTDAQGRANCDLVLNNRPGTANLSAIVGESQIMPAFQLTISPGPACQYQTSLSTQSFGAGGGTGTINVNTQAGCVWSAQSQASWLTVNPPASGTGPGQATFIVQANPGGARQTAINVAGQNFSIVQSAAGVGGALSITSNPTLPSATVNSAYSFTFQATGGTPPYLWTGGIGLPAGMSLSTTGVLGGTPSVTGTYTFAVQVSDAAGAIFPQTFTLAVTSVAQGQNPTITNTFLPSGVVGQSYQVNVNNTPGCTTPFSPFPNITVVAGALPAGVTLNRANDRQWQISGTPTTAGAFTFTLTVTDSCGRSSSATFTITIAATGSGGSGSGLVTVFPQTLVFNVTAGNQGRPPDQLVQVVSVSPGVAYSSTVNTANGIPWISISSGGTGTTPAFLAVGVSSFATFGPGTYSGIVVISTAGTPSATIQVVLNVTPAAPIVVTPQTLTFTSPQLQAPGRLEQSVSISSSGVSVRFLASVSTATGVNWLSVSPAAADTPSILTAIVNPVGLAPGFYTGQITIQVANAGPFNIPVSLTVTAPPLLTWGSRNLVFLQAQGSASSPQTVSLNSSGPPIRFQLTSGSAGGNWLVVSPTEGVTPASINVTVNPAGLPPGTYNGQVTARAADGSTAAVTLTVSLTITQNTPTVNAITNAASFSVGPIAPGMFAVLFGNQIGPPALAGARINDAGRIDTTVAETRVLFDEIPAPILYTSDSQTAVIVPQAIAGRRNVNVVVSYRNVRSFPLLIQVADSNPGIFTIGPGQAAATNADSTLNTSQNGAEPGSIVTLYATGEGLTNPAPPADGALVGSVLPTPRLPVTVFVDGLPAEVLYAGGAPGFAYGFLQVNVRVPLSVRRGAQVAVQLNVGLNASQPNVGISIRP